MEVVVEEERVVNPALETLVEGIHTLRKRGKRMKMAGKNVMIKLRFCLVNI